MTSTTTDETFSQDTTDSKEFKKHVKQGEKLYAKLAKARKALKRAQQKLAKAQARLEDNHTVVRELEQRLLEFEQEHARQSSTEQAQETGVAPAPEPGTLAEEAISPENQEHPAAASVDTSAPPQEERRDVQEQSEETAPSLRDEQDVVPPQATSTRSSASSRASRAATSRQRSTRSRGRSSSTASRSSNKSSDEQP